MDANYASLLSNYDFSNSYALNNNVSTQFDQSAAAAQPTQTSTSENKELTLPDGSIITKTSVGLIIKASTGLAEKLKSPPVWNPPPFDGFVPHFETKEACVKKLSNNTNFGERWATRYIILDQNKIYWYKKKNDSQPLGVIKLRSDSWIKPVDKTSPKRQDAHLDKIPLFGFEGQPESEIYKGFVGKDNCLAVHREPDTTVISAIMLSQSNLQQLQKEILPRTFYFQFSNTPERGEWERSINNNLENYLKSDEVFQSAVDTYCIILKRLGVPDPESWDWKPILRQLSE